MTVCTWLGFGLRERAQRQRCLSIVICVWLAAAAYVSNFGFPASAAEYFVYVGTYTTAQSKGIYMFRFEPATGEATEPSMVAEVRNASFLAIAPNGQHLYAVNETDRFEGKPGGAVSAFQIDRATGRLTALNQVSARGSGPCHLAVDPSGKCLVVANYGSGTVASFPVRSDGTLGETASFFQHEGNGANPRRQEGPHAHGATFDAAGEFVFVPDLGLDKIVAYRVDAAKAILARHDPPWVSLPAGSGPRHFIFHPTGRFGYVINELACTVGVFDYDASAGRLQLKQTVSTLPDGFSGDNTTAEIEIDRKGRFLYASNRGYDSLATYKVGKTGTLRLVGHTSTQGKTPRHFSIAPSGEWLWVGNQNSNTVVLFRLDPKTGALVPGGKTIQVGAPVCVTYLRAGD